MNILSRVLLPTLMFGHISGFAQGIVNAGFESGRNSGWTESSTGGYALIGTAAFFASTEISPPVVPHSGQYMGRVGGFAYEVNSLSQTVSLPATTPLYLKLFVQDRNSTTSECAGLWVGAQIRLYVAGQTLYDEYLCYYYQTETWVPVYFDLSGVAGQTVQIKVQADAANSVWSFLYMDDISFTNSVTEVENEKKTLPITLALRPNYPNPFNPSTTLEYQLPMKTNVSLEVFDLLGQRVAMLVHKVQDPGTYSEMFDARHLPTGMYIARLTAGNSVKHEKMFLLK